jgi:glycosyltransferase involved in cell wall biosynthesis
MQILISIIICTHNPRRDYLDKVLGALQAQTLPFKDWEVLLVDNASSQLLSSGIDISWHPNALHIREEQLGLTPARLRGIRESQAELLIFVDDDNVLDSDYLEETLRISKEFSFLGAWGGEIRGEFEVSPPDWAKPYLPYLALREFKRDKWSNLLHQHETTPCGAGLCVRKSVANQYLELTYNDQKRLGLDRKGKLIISGGDSDLAFTACDMGLGTGQFTALKLTHLIPANRLDESYLLKLSESMTYSNTIVQAVRGDLQEIDLQEISVSLLKQKLRECYYFLTMSPRERRFQAALQNGRKLAIQHLKQTITA